MTAVLPLGGVAVGVSDRGTAEVAEVAVARRVLSDLGAAVLAPDDPAVDVVLGSGDGEAEKEAPPVQAVLTGSLAAVEPVGVPDGTLAYAGGLALAAAALAAVRGGGPVTVPVVDVALQVFLPQVVAAAYDSDRWPEPPDPVPAPGGGWLSCELGAPGDRDTFDRLLATLPGGTGAADIATAAQQWRLPVCDYRRRPVTTAGRAGPPPAGEGSRASRSGGAAQNRAAGPPLRDVTVCDLTTMWAGPLCTWLLGRLGATVWKVEPDVRLDGMRARDDRGIHPGGRPAAAGADSGLFNALNSGKRRAPLDLRDAADRRRFLALVSESDLVVDSFSPRVMPNLGLGRGVTAGAETRRLTLSIPAFGPGPLRDWVAYGTGIHAVSGLGDLGCGGVEGGGGGDGGTAPFAAPAVTYPDPLGGLAAAVTALAGLVGRDRGWRPDHLEVPLLSATLPVLELGGPSARVAERERDYGRRLLAAAGCDAMAPLRVAGTELAHPVGPFRGPNIDRRLGPVPTLDRPADG